MTDDKGAGEEPYGHKKYPIAGGGKKHSQSCQACAYAEGLRMAAEMFRDSQWVKFKESVPIDGYDFYQSILAKAKEIEEGAK